MVTVLGVLLALGLLGLARLARGLPLVPSGLRRLPRRRNAPALRETEKRTMVAGLVTAGLVLLVTRNLVFAVVAGGGVVLAPMITGGGKEERAALVKLEALAQWTESLAGLAQKGAGLESVIPKTVETASDVLAEPLRRMTHRLRVYTPLPEALSLFADEVDDPRADQVVGALSLAARQRKGQLSRVLETISGSLRDELEQRTKVMRERNTVRREAAKVAALTAVLVAGGSLFAPSGPPGGEAGAAAQVLPLVFAVAYLAIFARVRKLAQPDVEPRFLSSASEVLEAASYRPRAVNL